MKGKFIKGEYLKTIAKLINNEIDFIDKELDNIRKNETEDKLEQSKLRDREKIYIEDMWELDKIKEYIEK